MQKSLPECFSAPVCHCLSSLQQADAGMGDLTRPSLLISAVSCVKHVEEEALVSVPRSLLF